jgi:hypothetical protein
MIVEGKKTCEIRGRGVHCVKPGERFYISTTQDKHQGRKIRPSLIGHDPRKGEIIGSVVFSHWEVLEWSDFEQLEDRHQVTDRELAMTFANKRDGKVRGWFFDDAVMAPSPREYKIRKGSIIWREFHGWN